MSVQSQRSTRPSGGSMNLDVTPLLRSLVRRRWVALITFLVIAVPASYYTLTMPDEYDATVRLQVGIPLADPTAETQASPQSTGPTKDYFELLRSRTVARHALLDLKVSRPGPFVARKGLLTGSGGNTTTPPSGTPDEKDLPVDAFLANLRLTPIPESRLVDVTVTANGPEAAAALANALARQVIRHELDLRFASSSNTAKWLEDQLSEQRRKVAASEAALQQYKEREDALAVEDRQNIVVQRLSDLNSAVTRAKTERIAKEETYKRLQELQQQPGATDTFPGILGSAYIQQLKSGLSELMRERAQLSQQYGELHPEMKRIDTAIAAAQQRLEAEVAKLAESVRNEYLAAVAQERSLTSALETQKAEAMSLNRKGVDYGALQREAEGNRQLYERLLQQTKKADLSADVRTSTIAVVDPAEPPAGPARPARGVNTAGVLAGALLFALGAVALLELTDRKVTSPDQVKETLGLPFLGYVPLTGEVPTDEVILLHQDAAPAFREAMRRVRANLLLSSATEGSRTLAVTSTAPREGKTVMATNLAVALAQTGLRVLLVDADLRRSRLHDVFDVKSGPGLASVLAGTASLDQALTRSSLPELTLLPAGPHPPNPAELLSSTRFKALVKSLAASFEWVIFDTPPIMAVADATVIAREVTGVVYVVGADMIGIDVIEQATGELRKTDATFLGAILNRMDVEGERYYYSRYHRSEYESYYVKSA